MEHQLTQGHRLLVVDDDRRLLGSLGRGLELIGFQVATAASAGEAIPLLSSFAPDVVILDVAMPGLDGLTFCGLIRRDSNVPILMLTARDELQDRVAGLEAGADDYLVKPFELDELVARLKALIRRASLQATLPGAISSVRTFDELKLDRGSWQANFRETSLSLTATEFLLLEKLMSDPRRVFSRDELLRTAWSDEGAVDSNAVDVHISNLRRKLGAAGAGHLIRTVRRIGYALQNDD